VLTFHPGKNATEAFEDVGHSDEARGMLTKMLVGDFEGGIVRAEPLLHLPPTTHGRVGPAEAGCGRGRVDGQGRRVEELVVVLVRSACYL
jgi:hypothetical protein